MKTILLSVLLLSPPLVWAQTLKPIMVPPPTGISIPDEPITSADYKPSIPALDNKNGFRDLKFGSRLSQIPGMVRISPKEEVYKRITDKLSIGQGQLKSISYEFHKGVLYGVRIRVVGQGNSYAVLQALKSEYGEPHQPNEYLPKYYWFGSVASLSFDENSLTHDALIFTYNTALLTKVVADDKEQAKPQKGDL